ncbi:hypothetical protein [Streptomyces lichenis]|uniref:Uncharacterized protein n=1 Tax=Streptomyces lichenis TaxID=2306967 RepID=A0ABT0IDU2_9ACTN|nr:hypothetical protein [Streptomyces lichenis]MCK8679498.1 hypothetical protein [Streptomyces lichenis]
MSGEWTPWVGDLVHDRDAGRDGIVTDVRGGSVWVLRPELGPGTWTSERPERLELVTSRVEMRGRL